MHKQQQQILRLEFNQKYLTFSKTQTPRKFHLITILSLIKNMAHPYINMKIVVQIQSLPATELIQLDWTLF